MKNKLLLLSALWIILFSPAYAQNQMELVSGRTTVDTRDSIHDEWLTGHIFEVDTRDSLALALSSNFISENQPAGSEVGRFTVVGGGSATYALVSGTGSNGNSNFTLSTNGVLKSSTSFDYEQVNQYSIRVRGLSTGKKSVDKVFKINISDLNEKSLTISLSPSYISENRPIGSEVGRFSVVEGGSASYSLVSGEGASGNPNFSLSPSGVLITAKLFDFEHAQQHSIRVGVIAPGKTPTEKMFTIRVLNELEPPLPSFSLSENRVKENQPVGTEVGFFYQKLEVVPDAPSFAPVDLPEIDPQVYAAENHSGLNNLSEDPLTLPQFPEIFTLVQGEGATHNYLFELRNGVLRTGAILDFETTPTLSIRVKDNGFSKAEQVFVIKVEDTEEPVQNQISLSNSSVMEKQPIGTEVGSFLINGKVDSGYMFSLVGGKGGADKEKFAVNGNVLSTVSALDANINSSLSIRVQAMKVSFVNGLPEFDLLDQTFQIKVNGQPVTNGLVLSRDSVWEGLPVGTTLTKIGSLVKDVFVESGNEYSLITGSGDDHNTWLTIEGNKVIARQPLNSNDSPILRFRVLENGSGLSQSFSLKVQKSTISQPYRKPYEDALETLKNLQREVTDLNATYQQNEDKLIASRKENEASRKVLNSKETQLQKLKEENLNLVDQEKELKNNVFSLEAKIAATVERVSNLNEKISDSSNQLSNQEEELTKIQYENEALSKIAKVPHLKGWHFLPNQGWILVDPDYYPLVYQSETNSWLSYEQGSSRPWNYYNHTTEQWESWE